MTLDPRRPRAKLPRLCPWFGHAQASIVTGERIDYYIAGEGGFLACERCGTPCEPPMFTPRVAEALRLLDRDGDDA